MCHKSRDSNMAAHSDSLASPSSWALCMVWPGTSPEVSRKHALSLGSIILLFGSPLAYSCYHLPSLFTLGGWTTSYLIKKSGALKWKHYFSCQIHEASYLSTLLCSFPCVTGRTSPCLHHQADCYGCQPFVLLQKSRVLTFSCISNVPCKSQAGSAAILLTHTHKRSALFEITTLQR